MKGIVLKTFLNRPSTNKIDCTAEIRYLEMTLKAWENSAESLDLERIDSP